MVKGVLIRRPRLCGIVFPAALDMNNPLEPSKSSWKLYFLDPPTVNLLNFSRYYLTFLLLYMLIIGILLWIFIHTISHFYRFKLLVIVYWFFSLCVDYWYLFNCIDFPYIILNCLRFWLLISSFIKKKFSRKVYFKYFCECVIIIHLCVCFYYHYYYFNFWFEVFTHVVNDLRYLHMLWMIWGIYTCCEWFEVFTHVVNDLRYLHMLWMIWGIYTCCEWFEVLTHVVNDLRY